VWIFARNIPEKYSFLHLRMGASAPSASLAYAPAASNADY